MAAGTEVFAHLRHASIHTVNLLHLNMRSSCSCKRCCGSAGTPRILKTLSLPSSRIAVDFAGPTDTPLPVSKAAASLPSIVSSQSSWQPVSVTTAMAHSGGGCLTCKELFHAKSLEPLD